MQKYRLVQIYGDVEPEIIGRFDDWEKMVVRARKTRRENRDDGLFWMEINKDRIEICAFGAGTLEG